jgi:outer membrane murein-binding lipoprotein Lpp
MDEGEQRPAAPTPPNAVGVLANLLGGDNGQKLLMALVLLAGGGNILNTNSNSKVSQEEIQSTVKEVHELHAALDGMRNKQNEMSENIKTIKEAIVKP